MKEIRGCFLVFLGIFGIIISIIISFTYYFLPVAFITFITSLVLISYALGPLNQGKKKDNHD